MPETPPVPAAPPPTDNPAVQHEKRDVNVRAIVLTGVVLAVIAVVVHLLVWGLFDIFQAREYRHKGSEVLYPPLIKSGRGKLPPEPVLDAFEAEVARLYLRTAEGKEHMFYIDNPPTIEWQGQNPGPSLFQLVGQQATVVFEQTELAPAGEMGGATFEESRDRVLAIKGPGKVDNATSSAPGTKSQAAFGTVERIEPKSVAARRERSEEDLHHFGWVEKDKVAHIPIEDALRLALQDRKLLPASAAAEGAGAPTPRLRPGEANSGRDSLKGQP